MKYSIVLRTRSIEINKTNKANTADWIITSIIYHNFKSQFTCVINYLDDLDAVEYILKHLNIKYEIESNTKQTDYYISISYDEYQKLIFLLKLEGEYTGGKYVYNFDIK